ncbi:MAG: ribosome small subunit-dependent GTPase A [Candidatus Gastranaerophilales bacterium]|nr:ribosome small subunit-dependent GTPase A [Candidatus Gastranaerophilales bacterium]
MQGKVIKIFSDFYYVQVENEILECKLREVLKKSGLQVMVGDNVIIDSVDDNSGQGAICEILERKNSIFRPAVANIDQIILVVSLKHPKTPLKNIDRYLAQANYFGIDVVICANKADLSNNEEQNEIRNIYSPLGYEIVFTSALNKTGINDLKKYLKDKTSIFCGASGVGKTSLCNAIHSNIDLKTGEVSKNSRGPHTTRHCEILSFDYENTTSNIVDTPGFSLLKFDYIEPQNVKNFFPEILEFSKDCKFSDCIHEHETNCNVINNLDKIAPSRYESYLEILQEAKEYKKKVQESGTKTETRIKKINSKFVPKISNKKRDFSRRKTKQSIFNEIE